jgi:hypothetical protein
VCLLLFSFVKWNIWPFAHLCFVPSLSRVSQELFYCIWFCLVAMALEQESCGTLNLVSVKRGSFLFLFSVNLSHVFLYVLLWFNLSFVTASLCKLLFCIKWLRFMQVSSNWRFFTYHNMYKQYITYFHYHRVIHIWSLFCFLDLFARSINFRHMR